MSEENQEQGFFGQLKTQIIGGVGILLTGIGTMFLDEVKSIVGIEDETEVTAPAQSNNQSVQVTGPDITINIPEQKTATQTIIREVPAKKDTVVVEQPKETSTNRLLKYKKGN